MKLFKWTWEWFKWLDSGKKGSRPVNAPKMIPKRVWVRYNLHKINRNKPHPLWSKPGMFVAWGLENKSLTPKELIEKLGKSGFKWIALQNTPENLKYALLIKSIASLWDIKVGIWEVPTTASVAYQAILDFDADFYIANIEENCDLNFPIELNELFFEYKAIVTNFGGISTSELARPWINAGFVCLPEAYVNDNSQATPINQSFEAWRLGWRNIYPVLGVYHDFPVKNYIPQLKKVMGYSIYLAEYMRFEDYRDISDYNV